MGDIHETYNVTFRYSALYAFDAVEAGMWAGVPGELTGLSAVGTRAIGYCRSRSWAVLH